MAIASPAPALAQSEGETPPKVQQIRAVERGLFVEADVGVTFIVNSINDREYPVGMLTGVFLGYDVVPWISIMIGVESIAASGPDDVAGPRGDLVFLNPMLQVQLALITTERDFLWARAGGGATLAFPFELAGQDFGGIGGAFSASIGYEHFTRVRHFSIGARTGVVGMTAPALAFGVTIMPTLKYTF